MLLSLSLMIPDARKAEAIYCRHHLCFWNVMECDKIEKKLGNLSGLVLGAFSHHLMTVINDRVGF